MTQLSPIVSVIFGATFTVAVSSALGFLLLERLRLTFHRLETLLFAFLAGAACLSLFTFLLCLLHQARWSLFLAGGSAAILIAARTARRQPSPPPLPPLPRVWTALFWLLFAAFFTCYFCNALAPEISPDGSSYHLGNVARTWRLHGFDWNYHSIYSSLSQGMEMLFLVAFSFGRHPAAAMTHLAFQTTLPLLMLCYGRRFGFPRAGACAALLVYASPVVGVTGISAYNDLTVATLLFAVFYLVQVETHKSTPKLMFLIGLLSGFAFSVKYTGGLAFLLVITLTRGRRILPLTAGAALIAAPWLLRNWIWLGNPTAPFLNSWFPNPYWSATAEHQYLAGLAQYPPIHSTFEFLIQVTVLGGFVPSMIGPVFLLLPLSLLALRHPHGRRLLFAGAVYSIPAFLNTDIRFLIPALPLFSLALALGLSPSWGALPALALLQAVLCWPAVMTTYCDRIAWRVRGYPFRVALRLEPEAQFISSRVADFALAPGIRDSVPLGSRIFSFAGRSAAYLDRDIVVGYESTQGILVQETLQHAALANSGQRAAAQKVKSLGLHYLLVDAADSVAENLKSHFTDWGITKLAEAHGTILYRLD